ncbi:MAG: hypothetical protein J2P25_02610 [Nocardiopsaceae bacterium]|nr:hypothetical protein [Nocardiopsaceae bacterium]
MGALLLVAAVYGGYKAIPPLLPSSTCASGPSTYLVPAGPTGDCVGFTSGSYVFDPSLTAVERDIQREDQRVTTQHPGDYVSVVMLLPISAKDGSIMSMTDVLNHLRGAYTAQHYANRHDIDGISPYIRILIGNAGYQANQWKAATGIIKGAIASQRIAAVTGLAVSLATTRDAALALTRAGIPVVGSTVSSDYFDDIRNMIRVSPSNRDEISVADAYARARFSRAILVEDENDGDIYDSTLVTGFEKFPDATHQIIGKEPYDTSYRDRPHSAQAEGRGDQVVRNRISQMIPDICLAQPAVVLFAGRGRDLAALVGDLADRPCLGKPITVITGDDVVNMTYSSRVRQGLASGVTIDYAGVAIPAEWSAGTGRAVTEGRRGFTTFKHAYQGLFPGTPLISGDGMLSYDATLTAISAIRLTDLRQPAPSAVVAEFPALQGAHTVLGASGPLAFTADSRSRFGSNPVGKAIPMLRVGPHGSPRFLTLNWPNGQPPAY